MTKQAPLFFTAPIRFVGRKLQCVLDLHVEETEAEVVVFQGGNVVGNAGRVVLAPEEPQDPRFGLQLGLQQRVAEKVGGVREGVLRERIELNDRRHDCVLYSILKDQFRR